MAETVQANYNVKSSTKEKITAIGAANHGLQPGKVVDWAVESLFEDLFGTKDPEPISIREELDRR